MPYFDLSKCQFSSKLRRAKLLRDSGVTRFNSDSSGPDRIQLRYSKVDPHLIESFPDICLTEFDHSFLLLRGSLFAESRGINLFVTKKLQDSSAAVLPNRYTYSCRAIIHRCGRLLYDIHRNSRHFQWIAQKEFLHDREFEPVILVTFIT